MNSLISAGLREIFGSGHADPLISTFKTRQTYVWGLILLLISDILSSFNFKKLQFYSFFKNSKNCVKLSGIY